VIETMNRLLIAVGVVAVLVAGAGYLMSGPHNYAACMDKAVTQRTDAGVKVAAIQCAKRFPEGLEPDWERGLITPPPGNTGKIKPFTGKLDAPGVFDDLIPTPSVGATPTAKAPPTASLPQHPSGPPWSERLSVWWSGLTWVEATQVIALVWLVVGLVAHFFSDNYFWRRAPPGDQQDAGRRR
jgi:hypothetical protein